MKYWKAVSLSLLGMVVSFAVVAGDADARGRGGQGMGLRDGSCIYGTAGPQQAGGQAMGGYNYKHREYGRGACVGANPAGGACPRLRDGTSPGYGAGTR